MHTDLILAPMANVVSFAHIGPTTESATGRQAPSSFTCWSRHLTLVVAVPGAALVVVAGTVGHGDAVEKRNLHLQTSAACVGRCCRGLFGWRGTYKSRHGSHEPLDALLGVVAAQHLGVDFGADRVGFQLQELNVLVMVVPSLLAPGIGQSVPNQPREHRRRPAVSHGDAPWAPSGAHPADSGPQTP